MGFTNSKLVNYTKLSPNHYSGRTHTIDTITIHCMAGNLTVEACGNIFANSSRQASSNYGIGSDGRIAMYVEESNGSWCSSNKDNDMRAITIEVANDGGAPDWHVSEAAMKSLIKLCADICLRNGIKKLLWKGDKNLIGQIDKQNMTVHRWFAAKACPGDYLYGKHSYIASEVNKMLAKEELKATAAQLNKKTPYSVRTTIDGVKLFDKLGGEVVKRYDLGAKLNVSKVYVYDNELWGQGVITKKFFRLKNTKTI